MQESLLVSTPTPPPPFLSYSIYWNHRVRAKTENNPRGRITYGQKLLSKGLRSAGVVPNRESVRTRVNWCPERSQGGSAGEMVVVPVLGLFKMNN
jgi:hypothetical protein